MTTAKIGLIGEKTEVNDILNTTGLNWKVKTEGIQTASGIVIPEKIALIREDNNTCLGVHGDGYSPYQNEELLELLYKVSQKSGLSLHSGGMFGGGEKVFIQLKSDDLKIGTDTIKGYVSGFNSFDGSTSLAFGGLSYTVSCQNTFWKGYKEVGTKLRHSMNMKMRIEDILIKIEGLLEEEKKTFSYMEKMSVTPMTQVLKELVTKRLFDLKHDERLDSPDLSTTKKNKIDQFYLDLDREISTKDSTMWGLFSGVTRYTTHSMKKGDNTVGKIFGVTGNKERAIFNELVEMI